MAKVKFYTSLGQIRLKQTTLEKIALKPSYLFKIELLDFPKQAEYLISMGQDELIPLKVSIYPKDKSRWGVPIATICYGVLPGKYTFTEEIPISDPQKRAFPGDTTALDGILLELEDFVKTRIEQFEAIKKSHEK